jgi:hypothetical protein
VVLRPSVGQQVADGRVATVAPHGAILDARVVGTASFVRFR